MLKIQHKAEQPQHDKKDSIVLGNLLIVDDEVMLLKLLERMFADMYTVRIAASGEEGLQILEEGFVPEVILADQRMPGMSGAEFLAKSRSIVPDAVRVILTGYTDVNDIISSINDGNVYKFLTKPWKNPDLLQTVRNCFDYYNLSTQNVWLLEEVRLQNRNLQELNDKLARRNTELRDLNEQIAANLLQTVKTLSSLISAGEMHYYTNHAQIVATIARALARELALGEETTSSIVVAALLHDIGKIGLPERILVADPETLSPADTTLYRSHVDKGSQLLQSVSGLERVASIVAQHHEACNGTGFPFGLDESNIMREAQIVAIADLYHNLVYRIPENIYRAASNPRSLVQPPELIAHRQAEARKVLYKRARHFRLDVFEAFIQLIKDGSCPPVQAGAVLNDPPPPYEMSDTVRIVRPSGPVPTPANAEMVSIPFPQVAVGMITAQDVYTADGTLVLPMGTVVDYHIFQKMREFYENRSIPTRLLFFKVK